MEKEERQKIAAISGQIDSLEATLNLIQTSNVLCFTTMDRGADETVSIEFNEDGTTIKSITISSSLVYSKSAEPQMLTIKLDKPFIYIIKDKNQLPLFIGYINDPIN